MYKFSYEEVLDEGAPRQKESERAAIQHSIELLRRAELKGRDSIEAAEALVFLNRLWSFFIEELCKPDNLLPSELKARIISIGLWLLREGDAIGDKRSNNFKGIIDVSETVAEGLQ